MVNFFFFQIAWTAFARTSTSWRCWRTIPQCSSWSKNTTSDRCWFWDNRRALPSLK